MVRGCFNCGGPQYQQSCELLCVGCPNSTHAGKDCANCPNRPVRRGGSSRGGNGGSFSQRGERPAAPVGHHGTRTWDDSRGGPVYPTMAYTTSPNVNQPGLYSYAPSSIQNTSGIYYQNDAPGHPFSPGTVTHPNTHGQNVSPFRAARPEQQRKLTLHNQISSTNPTTPWDLLQQRLYANREHFPCIWCGDYYHCLLDCPGQPTTWRAPLRTQIVQSGYENFARFFIVSLQDRHRPSEDVPFLTAQRRPYYSRTEKPNSMGVTQAQGQGRGEGRGGGDGGSGTSGRRDGNRQDGNRQPGEDQPAPPALPSTQTAFDEQRSPQHQIDESSLDMLGGATLM